MKREMPCCVWAVLLLLAAVASGTAAAADENEEKGALPLAVREDFEKSTLKQVVPGKGRNGSRGFVFDEHYSTGLISAAKDVGLTRYGLSFWAASPDGASTFVYLIQRDAKNRCIYSEFLPGTGAKLGPDFTCIEAGLPLAFADTRRISFNFYRRDRKGTVIFDDIELRVIKREPVPTIAPGDAVEGIENGGFEQGLDPKTNSPKHWMWKPSAPAGTVSTLTLTDDAKFVHDGKCAVHMASRNAHQHLTYERLVLDAGTEHLLWFWVKGKGRLLIPTGLRRVLSEEWVEMVLPVRLEKMMKGLHFRLYRGPDSWCAIDDVFLTVDGRKYPDAFPNNPARREKYRKLLQKLLQNL